MNPVAAPAIELENTFARDLEGLYVPWQAAEVPQPRLLALNEGLARDLGLDPDDLRGPGGIALLNGTTLPAGATPIAQGYAGHQFGGYSPRLGDGRALLIGEVIDTAGRRRDLHLKGSGRTPYSRGGDGKAAIGPMLREYLLGEAMHALGIPTTRALAVLGTGEPIQREEGALPGAVLVRVAASHLRVGSFQYAYALQQKQPTLLRRLADYAIDRHHPAAREAANPYLALLEAVLSVQVDLVAAWMGVGFVHGVLNTDNVTISGESIDYGPCAFMEAYDSATVFSSIDHQGRYAYGNQPSITLWNLSRFAETLLPLIASDTDAAVEAATTVLEGFGDRFAERWTATMFTKLGRFADLGLGVDIANVPAPDQELVQDLFTLMREQHLDWTSFWRALSDVARGKPAPARDACLDRAAFDAWSARWLARLGDDPARRARAADQMDTVNPVYIPRNHLVEEALAAATRGDLAPFDALHEAVIDPYRHHAGRERFAEPAPDDFGRYITFCGT